MQMGVLVLRVYEFQPFRNQGPYSIQQKPRFKRAEPKRMRKFMVWDGLGWLGDGLWMIWDDMG